MAFSAILKPSDYFTPTLYVGNGSTKTVTGVPFEPDMTWIKNRSGATDNEIYDKVRGVGYRIYTNTTAGQDDIGSQGLSAWTSDGFTVGNNGALNGNGNNQVSWNWKANGAGSSNTDGTINTIKTSANTTSGFSISTYTGTGSAGTIGHGLGVAPTAIITKRISASEQWFTWIQGITSAGGFLKLDVTNAASTNNTAFPWNPQANTFGVSGDAATNSSGLTYLAYCFAEKQGYSKMGAYTGNGNVDGSFIYTGFKPAFVMAKKTSGVGRWSILNNKSNPFNVTYLMLSPNETSGDYTAAAWNTDFLSNGFKIRSSESEYNANGSTYIYMAFAETPFVANSGQSIPTTAR